jgi:hypothetical protein
MDHPVVDLAGFVVILVAGLNQLPAQICPEIDNRIFVEHNNSDWFAAEVPSSLKLRWQGIIIANTVWSRHHAGISREGGAD